MTPTSRKTVLEVVQLSDIGLLFCCLGFSYALALHHETLNLFNSLETHRPIQVFLATIVLAAGWHATLRANGLYRSHRVEGYLREALDVSTAASLCALFSFVWLWLVCFYSRYTAAELLLISLLFGVLSFIVLIVTRLVGRTAMHALRSRGHNLRHVLIVGTNRRAGSFAKQLSIHPQWGYSLQGFVDDEWWNEQAAESNPPDVDGLLGGFDDLPALLRTLPVDEVIIALPLASFYRQIAEIVSLCRDHGIVVRSVGMFFEQEQAKENAVMRGTAGITTLHDESWSERAFMVKRLADVVISFTLLIALVPLLLLIAVLIKMTSPGPVFFSQTRIGYGKRPFQILKFRTMVPNAEKLIAQVEHLNETQGPTFKLKNDPRITPFGKLLRKTSLDEIPQLINVLIGDMSLVGPRPLPVRDYEGFSQDWHRRRFCVKPGITCLWQIMGRSSIGFDEWMALDLRYIDQWSIWLDVKILFQTIPAIFRGSGAM